MHPQSFYYKTYLLTYLGEAMKTINETFTNEEYDALKKVKGNKNWHDFILLLCTGSIRGEKKDANAP